ncbi:MAG: thioredoxin family protein [Duncaniella sp.]|nr:thioredoxin family protein [Duncaniella sp.]
MKSLYKYIAIGLCLISVSCAKEQKWHVNGQIKDIAENQKLILEGNNQGYWYVIDSIAPSKDGKFKYAGDLHGYPDIFRLRLGDKSIYFPIDSTETVVIEATAPDITANHTLGGSTSAVNLARVDSLINATAAAKGVRVLPNDNELKRRLGEIVVADPAGVVSYYVISKTIGDQALFNPQNPVDHRIIGAVANAFNTMRPDDPRTKYLTRLYLSNRRSAAAQAENGSEVKAQVVTAFEIDLVDNAGKRRSLLDVTSQGHPVILSFTAYGAEWSPAFNVELNKVYEKYRDAGLEIYQVSLDSDEYNWKQVAKNLPWITVLYNLGEGDKILRQYNVTALPSTFVFNRQGELVERILDIADLDQAVAKAR